ncbi:hypothetical protein NM688_g3733 [Phlebia brevispora]|uniref:Uncharacterized protein n=1 Tax=Phlebia brevispora TaxID=194682 RepID=A0ACC1T4P2_9APHY|nr:hypothetical protein NM688_g3733 [Phlebia brevispora]
MTPIFQHVLSKLQFRCRVPIIIRGSYEATYRSTDAWQIHVFSTLVDAFKILDPSILRQIVHQTYIKAYEEPTFESKTYARLLDYAVLARDSNTEVQRRVPPEVLNVLFRLITSILQDMIDGMTGSKTLDALNISHFEELLQFFFDTFPVMDRVTSNERWFMRSREQIHNLMTGVLSTPALISVFLECLASHRGFLTPDIWGKCLQHPAQRAFESLSTDDGANVLATITAFFQTKLHSQDPLTTYQTLICTGCVPFPPPSSDDYCAQLKRIFSLITASLNKAFHLPTRSLPLSPSPEPEPRTPKPLDGDCRISALAYSILSWIDGYFDGVPSGSESNWRHVQSDSDNIGKQNSHYYQWRDLFDVGESTYPDDLIALLGKLSTGDARSQRGRKFWRIRRLEDIERGDFSRGPGIVHDPTRSACSSMPLRINEHDAEARSNLRELQILPSSGLGGDTTEQPVHESQSPMVREDPVVGAKSLRTPAYNAPKSLGPTSDWKAQNVEADRRFDVVPLGQGTGLTESKEDTLVGVSEEYAGIAASESAGQ